MLLFALLVVYIIWPWSNRAGRRHSWITESWIILNGENYNSSFEGRLNIAVQEKYICTSQKGPRPATPPEHHQKMTLLDSYALKCY